MDGNNGRPRGKGRDAGRGSDERGREPRVAKRSREDEAKQKYDDRKPVSPNEPESEAGPSSRMANTDAERVKRPRGDNTDGRQERQRRERYEVVSSKPANLTTKKGESGDQIVLQSNYFAILKRPDWVLYMYRVDFEPECEQPAIRKRLIYEQKSTLGGYLYDTKNSVYISHRLPQDPFVGTGCDREGNNYTITMKFANKIGMDTSQSLQILNLILRRAMEGLKLQLVGRNLFDAAARIDIREFNIQLWPGYDTTIRQHETKILLGADVTNKVMRTETIHDIMRRIHKENPGNFREAVSSQIIGMTVLTDYTNKTYRIDEIDETQTPMSTFETKNGPITFMDYYKQKYNIRINDTNQHLLISRAKAKDLRAGRPDSIALVPELCRATGLSEQMRNDFRLTRAMSEYTRMDPRNRIAKLLEFNNRLARTQASMDVLKEWNFQLDSKLVDVPGRLFRNELIVFGERQEVPSGERVDWTQAFRNNSMYYSIPLRNWFIIYPNRSQREANSFVQQIQDVSRGMRFEVGRPQVISMYDDRNKSYIDAIENSARQDPQLIMLVVPNNNSDRYANIKKKCCVDRAIPTQVICHRTITPKGGNPNSLKSIATKVAIQMNSKLGGAPWMIKMPLSGLMTIGIDVARDSHNKNLSYTALVATMDLKVCARFFSHISSHSQGSQFSGNIAYSVKMALRAYRQQHEGALPSRILLYRDGVGDGQLKYVYETEVQAIVNELKGAYQNEDFRFSFVIVSKRINTRLFYNKNNPLPGTIVDDVVTLPERYDFFLVSQSVRQGTVSPTSYNVVYNSIGLPPDKLQQLTYKQTHLYYNWSGTTRVPAVCQYASKLATLVSQHIHQTPHNMLEQQLYYL